MLITRRSVLASLSVLAVGAGTAVRARELDKIRLAIFVSSSALPYYVGATKGYFEEAGLEVEPVPVGTHPLIVQGIISGDLDAAANLVTLEGANMDALRPGTMKFIAVNGQNSEYMMEQFVVKPDSPATSIADLKGANLFCAPGPANLGAAKASLAAAGLAEGDFNMTEQGMGNHVGAMQSGNFDGGYTLEPAATIMVEMGVAKRLETGVIAKYLMGDKDAEAYAAGVAVSGTMLTERPDVAKRFAEAWAKAVAEANGDPAARELLTEMKVPENLAATVPIAHFTMVKDLSEKQMADMQKFIDIGVELGVVAKPIGTADVLEAM